MRAVKPAWEQGYDSGKPRHVSDLDAHPNGAQRNAAMSVVMWHGGIDCAVAGYLPECDPQGAEDFLAGFIQALRDASAGTAR